MSKKRRIDYVIYEEELNQLQTIVERGRNRILKALRKTISNRKQVTDHHFISALTKEVNEIAKIYMSFKPGIVTWPEFNRVCNLIDRKIDESRNNRGPAHKKEIIYKVKDLLEKTRLEIRDYIYQDL